MPQVELNDLVAALQQVGGERRKHNLPAGFAISTDVHGPGGIFSVPGVDRPIFSTRVVPMGLMQYLAPNPTNVTHPVVGYLTGFTAGSGTTQSTPCADPPRAGSVKSCFQGAAFARIAYATQPVDMSSQGEQINRGEFLDLQLVNDPLLSNPQLLVPPSVPKSLQRMFAVEVLSRMIALGVEFEERISRMVYTGTPLNNNGTGYMEFMGLEQLITTVHRDVFTNANCPSLASYIADFQWANISTNAAALFARLTDMWRYINHNARTMNFMPVQWAFVMQESLFREISDYWPCVYATYRCNLTAGGTQTDNVDGLTMRQMSDDMFNGRYLQIDGIKVPVITDDAVTMQGNDDNFHIPNTCFSSDIYLLPITVKGNVRVLYMDYFNFAGPGAAQEAANLTNISSFIWSDGGAWLWVPRQTLYCFDWTALTRPRLRLDTPQLAGRLQNVVWCPLTPLRQPFRTDDYFIDGGNTTIAESYGAPYTYASLDI